MTDEQWKKIKERGKPTDAEYEERFNQLLDKYGIDRGKDDTSVKTTKSGASVVETPLHSKEDLLNYKKTDKKLEPSRIGDSKARENSNVYVKQPEKTSTEPTKTAENKSVNKKRITISPHKKTQIKSEEKGQDKAADTPVNKLKIGNNTPMPKSERDEDDTPKQRKAEEPKKRQFGKLSVNPAAGIGRAIGKAYSKQLRSVSETNNRAHEEYSKRKKKNLRITPKGTPQSHNYGAF